MSRKETWVVVIGNPLETQYIYGPFPSYDEAVEYGLRVKDEGWTAAQVMDPARAGRRLR